MTIRHNSYISKWRAEGDLIQEIRKKSLKEGGWCGVIGRRQRRKPPIRGPHRRSTGEKSDDCRLPQSTAGRSAVTSRTAARVGRNGLAGVLAHGHANIRGAVDVRTRLTIPAGEHARARPVMPESSPQRLRGRGTGLVPWPRPLHRPGPRPRGPWRLTAPVPRPARAFASARPHPSARRRARPDRPKPARPRSPRSPAQVGASRKESILADRDRPLNLVRLEPQRHGPGNLGQHRHIVEFAH